MKITILCVGKLKEEYLQKAVSEYKKGIGKYADLEIREVSDENTPQKCSETQKALILKKEGERLKKYMDKKAFNIALCIDGKKMDSVKFAGLMDESFVKGDSHIRFLIGGSLGLCDEIIKMSDIKLSFSDMTFPHQLMRVILTEQIYRAFRILKNEPYHK